MDSSETLTRRGALGGGLALACLGIAACSRSDRGEAANRPAGSDQAQLVPTTAMLVYRDPSCGCCENWASRARAAGFEVSVRDEPDIAGLKARVGIPSQLASCHTTVVGEYVLEGHVPIEYVAKLLRERPPEVRGLAVPGMPAGSPGMEVPGRNVEPFEVFAFDDRGVFRAYGRFPPGRT